MQKNKTSTSGKRKVNDNSSDQHSTKKTKVDNVLRNNGEDENTEREEEEIMHDFDFHDTINAESYEKHFENICNFLSQMVLLLLITPAITQGMQKTFSRYIDRQMPTWEKFFDPVLEKDVSVLENNAQSHCF